MACDLRFYRPVRGFSHPPHPPCRRWMPAMPIHQGMIWARHGHAQAGARLAASPLFLARHPCAVIPGSVADPQGEVGGFVHALIGCVSHTSLHLAFRLDAESSVAYHRWPSTRPGYHHHPKQVGLKTVRL